MTWTQLVNKRPQRCQGLLLVLLVGSAGQPVLALPPPGGGALVELGTLAGSAWAGVHRPRQSYQLAGGAAVASLPRTGLLAAQRLTGVVRCAARLMLTACPLHHAEQLLQLWRRVCAARHLHVLHAPVSYPGRI